MQRVLSKLHHPRTLFGRKQCTPMLTNVRFMSESNVENQIKDEDSIFSKIKKNATLSMTLGGGTIVLYGISKLLLDLTTSFMSLTPAVSLYYGFVGGLASAGVGGVLVNLGYNASRVHPERVFRQALRRVTSDSAVRARLGEDSIAVIDSKTYNATQGGWSLSGAKVAWRQPTVVLSFVLKGSKAESIVSVLASRSMFQWNDTLLQIQVTYLDDNSTVTVLDTLKTPEADHAEGNNSRKSQEAVDVIREHSIDSEKLANAISRRKH